MDDQRDERLRRIAAALGQNGAAIAEAWTEAFGDGATPEFGEPSLKSLDGAGSPLSGSGLWLEFTVGAEPAVALIPASERLPEWCRQPDEEQSARLQKLATAWGALTVEDAEASEITAGEVRWVEALHTGITDRDSEPNLQCCELLAAGPDTASETADDAETDAAGSPLRVVFVPLDAAPAPEEVGSAEANSTEASSDRSAAEPVNTSGSGGESSTAEEWVPLLDGKDCSRIRMLPVKVSVRLAEKQVPLRELLTISPGALLTFNKSCEGLLDLYVDNVQFCRGEAVKIGEKFGLKITEVGQRSQPAARLLK